MKGIDMVQDLRVEVDSWGLLEQYLRVAIPTVLRHRDKRIIVRIASGDEHLPGDEKQLPVLFVGGLYTSQKLPLSSLTLSDALFFDSPEDTAINQSILYVKRMLTEHEQEWPAEFTRRFGDGYHGAFNENDGSVHPGFSLTVLYSGGELWLAISLVHIYYGK